MVDNPTGSKQPWEVRMPPLAEKFKEAFDSARAGNPDKSSVDTQKSSTTQNPAPKIAPTLEMKGPLGDAVRRGGFLSEQQKLHTIASTRKPEDIQKMISDYNRDKQQDMVKSKDADERIR